MEKISENSILYELIHKPLLLWIHMYLFSVLGVFCKYYFNLKDIYGADIVLSPLFLSILLIMALFEWKSSKEYYKMMNWI